MKRKFSALVVVAFATMGVLTMLASPAGAQNFVYQCPSTVPTFSQTNVIIDINGALSADIVQQGDTLSLTDVVASLTLNVPAFPLVAQVPSATWRFPIPPGIEYVAGSGTFGGTTMPGDTEPTSGSVAVDGTDLLITIDPFQIDLAQLVVDGNVVPLPVGELNADFLVTADTGELKFGSDDIIINVVLSGTPFTLSCTNDDPANFFLAAGINQPPPELPPEPTVPPPTVAAAEVAAPPAAAAAPADLPRTGTATMPMVFAGLTLVLAGAGLVRAQRRRSATFAQE